MRLARFVGCVVLVCTFWPGGDDPAAVHDGNGWSHQQPSTAAAPPQAVLYICPMHAEVRSLDPGQCPRCGMTLVTSDPLDTREYHLDLQSTPPAPLAGRVARLRLAVRDPETRSVVRTFSTVHEKIFHLFIVSHDLEYYAHLHPEQQADGTFTLDVTLPRAGYYKVYSDFLPAGGTPQIIPRLLVTRDFDGDLASSAARLQPDRVLSTRAGTMRVTLDTAAGGFVAGRDETFAYHVTDADSGAPVRDIEPYLGAWGHSLIMSQDTLDFVHAHPTELLPEASTVAGGGPTLTFKAMLPKPGHYRIWTQIKRKGVVSTAVFTVRVESPTAW